MVFLYSDNLKWNVNNGVISVLEDERYPLYNEDKKWFNIRVTLNGISSSYPYDTYEEAISHRLSSDTDTISIDKSKFSSTRGKRSIKDIRHE